MFNPIQFEIKSVTVECSNVSNVVCPGFRMKNFILLELKLPVECSNVSNVSNVVCPEWAMKKLKKNFYPQNVVILG